MMTEHKKLKRYSDQYHCDHCGKTWDVNDPYPPGCKLKTGRDWIDEIKRNLRTKKQ